MNPEESTLDIEEFKQMFKGKFGSLGDIKDLLDKYLDRKDIDLITRIQDTELDKICNMLHHSHLISVKWNYWIHKNKTLEEIKKLSADKIKVCSGESYALRNLYLRLSLDSSSRKEIENILISLIKKELERLKESPEEYEE